MTTKTTTKTRRAPQAKGDEAANGTGRSPRKRRELTLDEMSLRAYKMTYERLHGKGKKQTAKLPKAA